MDAPLYTAVHEAILRVKAEHPNQRFIYLAWILLATACLPLTFYWWWVRPSVLTTLVVCFNLTTYGFNVPVSSHCRAQSTHFSRLGRPAFHSYTWNWMFMPARVQYWLFWGSPYAP